MTDEVRLAVVRRESMIYRVVIDPGERALKTFVQVLFVALLPELATHQFTYERDLTVAGLSALASIILSGLALLVGLRPTGYWDLIVRAAKTFIGAYTAYVITNGVVDSVPAHWVAALAPALTATMTSLMSNWGNLAGVLTEGASSVRSWSTEQRTDAGVPPEDSPRILKKGYNGPVPPVTEAVNSGVPLVFGTAAQVMPSLGTGTYLGAPEDFTLSSYAGEAPVEPEPVADEPEVSDTVEATVPVVIDDPTLGNPNRKSVVHEVVPPPDMPESELTDRQIAARKGAETRRRNREELARKAARAKKAAPAKKAVPTKKPRPH